MGSFADIAGPASRKVSYAPSLQTFSEPLSDPETCRSFR